MLPLEQSAVALALGAAGFFLLTGLLTGTWKYACMARRVDATAPAYVDICHRASLLYSFAALLLAVLAAHSAWSPAVNFWAVAGPLLFFALAIASYALHGVLDDTDNQLRAPHRLGHGTVSPVLIHGFMLALVVVEIAGVAVLVAGLWRTLQRL